MPTIPQELQLDNILELLTDLKKAIPTFAVQLMTPAQKVKIIKKAGKCEQAMNDKLSELKMATQVFLVGKAEDEDSSSDFRIQEKCPNIESIAATIALLGKQIQKLPEIGVIAKIQSIVSDQTIDLKEKINQLQKLETTLKVSRKVIESLYKSSIQSIDNAEEFNDKLRQLVDLMTSKAKKTFPRSYIDFIEGAQNSYLALLVVNDPTRLIHIRKTTRDLFAIYKEYQIEKYFFALSHCLKIHFELFEKEQRKQLDQKASVDYLSLLKEELVDSEDITRNDIARSYERESATLLSWSQDREFWIRHQARCESIAQFCTSAIAAVDASRVIDTSKDEEPLVVPASHLYQTRRPAPMLDVAASGQQVATRRRGSTAGDSTPPSSRSAASLPSTGRDTAEQVTQSIAITYQGQSIRIDLNTRSRPIVSADKILLQFAGGPGGLQNYFISTLVPTCIENNLKWQRAIQEHYNMLLKHDSRDQQGFKLIQHPGKQLFALKTYESELSGNRLIFTVTPILDSMCYVVLPCCALTHEQYGQLYRKQANFDIIFNRSAEYDMSRVTSRSSTPRSESQLASGRCTPPLSSDGTYTP